MTVPRNLSRADRLRWMHVKYATLAVSDRDRAVKEEGDTWLRRHLLSWARTHAALARQFLSMSQSA